MPKIPGRESTRKTVDLDQVGDVYSFLYVWDHDAARTCMITGCDHRIGGIRNDGWKPGGEPGQMPYITCGEGSQTSWVYSKKPGDQTHYAICVCHHEELDRIWREIHGTD
jgi:hypothetical protein